MRRPIRVNVGGLGKGELPYVEVRWPLSGEPDPDLEALLSIVFRDTCARVEESETP